MLCRSGLVLVCLFLVGCAGWDTTRPTRADLNSFDPSRDAYLVVNFTGRLGCDWITLGINRQGSDFNEVVFSNRDESFPSSEPAIIKVPAGTYRLNRGGCQLRRGAVDLRRAAAVHGEVEVGAGEVVYLGALEMNRLRVEYAVPTISGETYTETADYYLFQMVDEIGNVRPRVARAYPQLAQQMVARIPEVIISPEEVEARIRGAYLPDSQGRMPTRDEAQRRIFESVFEGLERELEQFEAAPAPSPFT